MEGSPGYHESTIAIVGEDARGIVRIDETNAFLGENERRVLVLQDERKNKIRMNYREGDGYTVETINTSSPNEINIPEIWEKLRDRLGGLKLDREETQKLQEQAKEAGILEVDMESVSRAARFLLMP